MSPFFTPSNFFSKAARSFSNVATAAALVALFPKNDAALASVTRSLDLENSASKRSGSPNMY